MTTTLWRPFSGSAGAAAWRPEEAIAEAFDDLRMHELATISAMQAAVRVLLAQFDPETIERKAGSGALQIHPAQKKAKAWEAFVQLHKSVTQALSDDFDSVFGKAFARAYEQAIEKLTADRGVVMIGRRSAARGWCRPLALVAGLRRSAATSGGRPDHQGGPRHESQSGRARRCPSPCVSTHSMPGGGSTAADVFLPDATRARRCSATKARGSEEVVVRPGETRKVTLTPKPGVRFLGIAVLFRDIDRAQWRAIAPIAASGHDPARARHRRQQSRTGARMTWSNRVVWLEGMFLRAQHFQQQDRWLEALVRDRTAALRPHAWGLTEGAINRNLLATGQFALASGSGVFEDGTPFALPGETDQPVPLELPETTRNAIVYLVLPVRQAGSVEVAANGSSEGRYEQRPFEAYDTHSGSPQPAEVQVGRLRLRYMLETDNRAGYHGIGLARVVEVGADRGWCSTISGSRRALTCAAAPPLAGLLAELAGMLNQRGEALAARLTAPGSRGVADVSDFLLLQSVNRCAEAAGALGERRQRPSRRSLRRPRADGRRLRDLHRSEPPSRGLSALSACRPAAQLRAGRLPICAVRCRR